MDLALLSLIEKEFGFKKPSLKKINGYHNANYLLTTKNNSKYILKSYPYSSELLATLEAENEILFHLADETHCTFPKPIVFSNREYLKVVTVNETSVIYRLLSFIEGEFLAETKPNIEVYQSLGTVLAKTNQKLNSLASYVLQARKWEWDLQYFSLNKKYLSAITNSNNRSLVLYFFRQFEEHVAPIIPQLRKQILHNDANEWNVLVTNTKVSGLIDFGDLAYTPLINEVAIAMTYAGYDKENPLDYALPLLKSYHQVTPLKKLEVSILYYLIAARLCTSVCNSAHAKKIDPKNSYAGISEENAWKTLHKWIRYNPISIENQFREATGFTKYESEPLEIALAKREKNISSILSVSYKKPIQMNRAAFQYMYDAHGNTFLDAYNNIPHVGHSHPKVVEAGQSQMGKLNTNTRYIYDLLAAYSEKLLAKFPSKLNKVFFVNSGSAASDLAIRLAKQHTKRTQLLVMEHGYHGNTQLGIDISDYKFNNPKGQGQKNSILKTRLPDTYRGKYTGENAGKLYADEAIKSIHQAKESVAAFISEPIVGCGGQAPLAKGYLKELYPTLQKQGTLCISDEVQTGFGRLGTHFWGFQMHGVIPDMVVLGKPMGNGHPIGAVVVTEAIAKSFENGVEFFSSFGGNPVSCAIGLSVLEVLESEGLQQNAALVGSYYKSLFKELQEEYRCIGDVRGEGLFLGVDIVKEGSKETDRKLARIIKNELRNRHILISTDGPDDSVLKTKPPLCFTKQNADEVVETIATILKKNTS